MAITQTPLGTIHTPSAVMGESVALPNPANVETTPVMPPQEQTMAQEVAPGRIKRAALYVASLVGKAIQAAPEIVATAEGLGALEWAQRKTENLTGSTQIAAKIGLGGLRQAAALHRERMAQTATAV